MKQNKAIDDAPFDGVAIKHGFRRGRTKGKLSYSKSGFQGIGNETAMLKIVSPSKPSVARLEIYLNGKNYKRITVRTPEELDAALSNLNESKLMDLAEVYRRLKQLMSEVNVTEKAFMKPIRNAVLEKQGRQIRS